MGVVFQGDFYRKRFDLLREVVPFEITLDHYISECEGTTIDEGTILKENGQFYWETNTNERWSLLLDVDNEGFLLGANSPAPGTSLELITLEESCGLHIPGFFFENNYYWRPMRNAENPVPVLVNSVADLTFPENFNLQTIDISTVFSDVEGEPLFFFATSSDPMQLGVIINGEELEFSGGVIGNYEICLTAIDENGGVVTHTFMVMVGLNVSTNDQSFSNLVIYPNPVEEVLNIRNAPSSFDVTIYSVHSTIYQSYKNLVNSASIDLSNLPSGIYFMKIEHPINGTFRIEKILRN